MGKTTAGRKAVATYLLSSKWKQCCIFPAYKAKTFSVLLSGRQNRLVPRAPSHRGSKAGRSEIGAVRGNEGPASAHTQSCLSTKQERADPLTQIGPCLETDSWFSRNPYIIGNKVGQTKTGSAGAGEHTHDFPRRLNSTSPGRPRGPTLLTTIEAPSTGR